MRPRVLTVAGSDPSGGGGVQQDLRTFAALGVWGLSAVTAVTVQDTARVAAVGAVGADAVRAQIDAVVGDLGCAGMKTGLLPDAAVVAAVSDAVERHGIGLVVIDPVLVATSGDRLADDDVPRALRELLIPRATIVTPNASEAAVLTGIEVRDEASQTAAARALVAMGADAALVTGGHIDGPESVDVLVTGDDVRRFAAARVAGPDPRGTGCMLSAAIVAGLVRGSASDAAVAAAKRMVSSAMARAEVVGARAVLDPFDGRGT